MWIRTQNNQRVINSNQIVDIFIDKTGTKIYAESILDRDFFLLGEYKDRDTCLRVLDVFMVTLGHEDVKWVNLPLGGDVESWLEDSHNLAVSLYS